MSRIDAQYDQNGRHDCLDSSVSLKEEEQEEKKSRK